MFPPISKQYLEVDHISLGEPADPSNQLLEYVFYFHKLDYS